MHDLDLISGQFFEKFELPKEKKYLLKYYDTPLQQSFLKYVIIFGNYDNFCQHTGIPCRPHWMKKLHSRLIKLESLHKDARKNFDIETVARIEQGKYKL